MTHDPSASSPPSQPLLKRFLVFAGKFYYPYGGFRDLRSSHDDMQEALEAAREAEHTHVMDERADWWHVVDASTGKIVADSVE